MHAPGLRSCGLKLWSRHKQSDLCGDTQQKKVRITCAPAIRAPCPGYPRLEAAGRSGRRSARQECLQQFDQSLLLTGRYDTDLEFH